MNDKIINNIYNLNDDIKKIIYNYFIQFQFIEKKKINNHVLKFFYAKKLLKMYNYENILNIYSHNDINDNSAIDYYHNDSDYDN
ncbi:MAG: hypothetical protein CBB97_24685 [Candidatus Endolissoclinum sp. TMED37]|nr:MAG: hypothetical protein CBB97_24685 [Candidatus Endolissoclinum sp. TMED37]